MLLHLVATDDVANAQRYFRFPFEWTARTLGGRRYLSQSSLGGAEQILSLARPLLEQERIAANHEAVPRTIR